MNIFGNKVKLRAIEPEDQELLRDMVNNPAIETLVVGHSFPVSKRQQKNWSEGALTDSNNIRLIIETAEEGAIGFANIVNIDWKNRAAFHGIKIAKKSMESKGIGTDTVMAVMRYAFDELQLNRLDTTILSHNQASIRLYTGKCGWKTEGVKKEAIFKNGQYHDLNIVGILKSQYQELIKKGCYWD